VGPPHVDVMLAATLKFPSGIVAQTLGDMRAEARFKAELEVTGDAGTMTS
jgi:hypothetical protein